MPQIGIQMETRSEFLAVHEARRGTQGQVELGHVLLILQYESI